MAPLTVSLYNLSLSPRRIQAPEARSDLWREAVGLSTSTLCCQPTGSLVRRILFVVTAVHSRQETLGKKKKKKERERRQACDSGDKKINTISHARGKLKRISGKTASFCQERKPKEIYLKRTFYFPLAKPMTDTFSVKSLSLWIPLNFQTLSQ